MLLFYTDYSPPAPDNMLDTHNGCTDMVELEMRVVPDSNPIAYKCQAHMLVSRTFLFITKADELPHRLSNIPSLSSCRYLKPHLAVTMVITDVCLDLLKSGGNILR